MFYQVPTRFIKFQHSIHTALDFQFSQEVISEAEENGTVRVCVEIVTDIFLPRNVEIRVFTQDGNATGNYRIARIFRGGIKFRGMTARKSFL